MQVRGPSLTWGGRGLRGPGRLRVPGRGLALQLSQPRQRGPRPTPFPRRQRRSRCGQLGVGGMGHVGTTPKHRASIHSFGTCRFTSALREARWEPLWPPQASISRRPPPARRTAGRGPPPGATDRPRVTQDCSTSSYPVQLLLNAREPGGCPEHLIPGHFHVKETIYK